MRTLFRSLCLFGLSLPAHALEFVIVNPDQNDFRSVAEDIAAALNYKALAPAEATGLTGFGLGAFASYAETDDPAAWQRLTGEDVDGVGMVGVAAHKGLPLNLDLGAFYATVPGTDARVLGGELRWAWLPGSAVLPALAIRASATEADDTGDFDYSSRAVDVSVSKGFTLVTPYAGAGYVWSTVEADPATGLQDEDIDEPRYYAGLRLSLLLLSLTPEIERQGERTSYNLRIGLSF